MVFEVMFFTIKTQTGILTAFFSKEEVKFGYVGYVLVISWCS